MPIELNHTIVYVKDQEAASTFLTELFDLPAATRFGPFHVVEVDNGVSLDYISTDHEFEAQHYAFLVSEDEFTAIFGRIVERGLEHWADPQRRQAGEINHHDGGRGVYWADPNDHLYEIITRPYGSGG
jgi:catechol 2,3-dioxygenase-like lactoylglutathione lyase family enzyme